MMCPYCLSEFDWDSAPLVNRDGEDEIGLWPEPGENDVRWRNRTMHAWRVCEKTGEAHFIPASLGGMTTLIVGMVGKTGSGKSTLLWALTQELGRSALKITHRLDVLPLDPRLQQELFDRNQLDKLNDRKVLPATRTTTAAEFACAYRITSGHTGREYALLIFDVSGEVFTRGGVAVSTPFMAIADALMFVADGSDLDVRHGRRTGDPGFTAVLSHLSHVHPERGRDFLPIPAALVVAKSDTLRVFKEVDEWLTRKDDGELHTVERESEDVYAFLKERGADSWLLPVLKCADSTLHLASATGVEARDGEYPERSFRRQRVLRPLLSLLAMKGVLPRESLGAGPEGA
jgi:energy-coupling factor transporter ATP-binding protein EcfA2